MKCITWRGRGFAIATVALAAGLVAAAGAGAAPPTREDLGVFPYEFSVDCSPYGFAFANNVLGQESLWVETFYDTDGNPVKIVVHDSFTETDTNSVTGKTLPFGGQIVETFDLVSGTRTVVGKEFLMTEPGKGVIIHDVGRVVFDAPFHVSFEAGRHNVLHGGTGSHLDQLACSALAAD